MGLTLRNATNITTQALCQRCHFSAPPVLAFGCHRGSYLHHNFVCVLLNDLFGVQARAGCQCAGPYAINLLGVTDSVIPKVTDLLTRNVGIIKLGFCRLSLAFFASDAEASKRSTSAHEVQLPTSIGTCFFTRPHGCKFRCYCTTREHLV